MINGVALGSLYGLIAIGYTMVYGIIRLINFAHGDVMMMGCYFAYFGILMFSLPWWASFAAAIVLTAALGVLMDKGAYVPVRNAPRISALITAIGVSFLLENLGLVVFGGRPKGFETPDMFNEVYEVAGLMFPALVLWTPLLTLAILGVILFIIYRTKTGRAMRCISHDMETTKLMGVDVNRIISITFAVGSAAAAAGGIMWAMRYPENGADGHHPRFQGLCCRRAGGHREHHRRHAGRASAGDRGDPARGPDAGACRISRRRRLRPFDPDPPLPPHGADGNEAAGKVK